METIHGQNLQIGNHVSGQSPGSYFTLDATLDSYQMFQTFVLRPYCFNENLKIYFNHCVVVASWLLNYSSFPEEFQLQSSMGENASQKQGEKIELPLLFDYMYTRFCSRGHSKVSQYFHEIPMIFLYDLIKITENYKTFHSSQKSI